MTRPRRGRDATRCAGLLLLLVAVLASGCASTGRSADDSSEEKERPKRTVLMTTQDDVRVGREAAEQVESQVGLLEDPELACVLGHEIVHVFRRHAAQQQAVARYQGLSLPSSRAQTLAAYSRDMEREADALGQQLAAAAGYDLMDMSTFMRSLDQRKRLLTGAPRAPTFFHTHPGTRERASANAIRLRELRWTRDVSLGDTRARLLDRIDGMAIGDRPETGIFVQELFLHPGLDFEVRFPKGWRLQNTAQVVGASAPRGEAAVYLTGDMPAGDLVELADGSAEKVRDEVGAKLRQRQRVKLGPIDAVRYSFEAGPAGRELSARVTFFPFAEGTWHMVGLTPVPAGNRYLPQILLTTRSFRPLSDEHRALIHEDRLRVVLAHAGEDLAALGDRTENAWSPAVTALANGRLGNEIFEGGELVKILRRERPTLVVRPGWTGASDPIR